MFNNQFAILSENGSFFFCSTGAWTQGLHLEPLHQPIFCEGFLEIGSWGTICLGWLQTTILLISASWIVRIASMSHWHLAEWLILIILYLKWCSEVSIDQLTLYAYQKVVHLKIDSNTVYLKPVHLRVNLNSVHSNSPLVQAYGFLFSGSINFGKYYIQATPETYCWCQGSLPT
jgi:hypothetical protein